MTTAHNTPPPTQKKPQACAKKTKLVSLLPQRQYESRYLSYLTVMRLVNNPVIPNFGHRKIVCASVITTFNPFSGGFFNTMSHLPGRVLNFKNPRAGPFYSGYRKKI
jgi:hypothetical protein